MNAAFALGQLVRRTDPYYVPAPTADNPRAVCEVENPKRGRIVEVTDERVRIQWLNKDGSNKNRTWMSRKQYGKTWALV